MARVCIAIATCKRPHMLARALSSVEKLATAHDVFVVVADNDADSRAGAAVVADRRRGGYRFPLAAIVVAERGISQARNALVAEAFGAAGGAGKADAIAFVDDDQWVEPGWLDALLAMQQATGADVVGSDVRPEFEAPPPAWAARSGAYRDRGGHGPVAIIYGTNGTLVSTRAVARLALPWFDPAFGLTGGGDSELFHRLRDAGASFARAGDAVIHEVYPPSRVTLRWALQRAFRIGLSDTRIVLAHHGLGRALRRHVPLIFGAVALAPLLLLARTGRTGAQVDALCTVARACGKVAALSGYRFKEYAVTHGR